MTEVYANYPPGKGRLPTPLKLRRGYDLLDNRMLPGLPPEKKPAPPGGSPAYQRLEDVGRRLMEVIAHNKGGTSRSGPVRRPAPRPHRSGTADVSKPPARGPGVFRAPHQRRAPPALLAALILYLFGQAAVAPLEVASSAPLAHELVVPGHHFSAGEHQVNGPWSSIPS